MKFKPRKYQADTVNAWWDCRDMNSAIAVPTGAGKTVIMGMFIKRYIDEHPYNHVVVLSHTQDILEQDHAALQEFFPDREIGLYSAGLKVKEVRQITVAGIQTAYRNPQDFTWTNLYIIDECHTVNHKNTGMYRSLLADSPAPKLGMSATVFRTGHGFIYENDALFDNLAYDLTSVENFNKLVADGYLTKLISKTTEMEMDVDKLKMSAGDYNIKQLGERFDRDSITSEACEELVKYGNNYKKWLVFAIDTDHANNIYSTLTNLGIESAVLHSKMNGDRKAITKNFKHGSTRALVSVGMVTTGFDAPNIDLIALLRPTKSAVLHVQMIGRGLRVAPGKSHCLVLDFAGNTMRLGPINNVTIPKQKGVGDGEAVVKTCPSCGVIQAAAVRVCDVCGHKFEFKTLLKTKVDTTDVVQEDINKWLQVDSIHYKVHSKYGSPDSLMVEYLCGITRIREWVCLDHNGYAKVKADHWATFRGYTGSLDTHSVFNNHYLLKVPKKIHVDFSSKFPVIKNSVF